MGGRADGRQSCPGDGRDGKPLVSDLVITDRKKRVVERHTLNDTATGTVGMPDHASLSLDFMEWLFPHQRSNRADSGTGNHPPPRGAPQHI